MNFLKDSSIYLRGKQIEHPLGIFPFVPQNENINLQINIEMKQSVKVSF